MHILVLGATGYLGSHITRCLVMAGLAVHGLSRTESGDAIVETSGAMPVRGDLSNLAPVLELVRSHDAVIYAAQLLLQPEFDTVSALLAAMADGGERTFLFTSGTGVLAQRTDGQWSEDSFAEDDPFLPSPHIGFRHVTETLVRQRGAAGNLRAMVVRPPMIWGNGGCGHLRLFYRDGGRSGDVGYLGSGLNLYSNVHVDDLAMVYRLALEKGVGGALYHAVAGEANNRALAEAVARDLDLPTRSIDFAEGVARWGKFETLVGMATCSRTRSPRTRRELGWEPRHLDILTDIGHPAYRSVARDSAATERS